jgi:dihydrofolate reductase
MTVSIIVAMAANRVIGRDGGLPWRLRADLRRFKRLTMGHHLVVGRRTWQSIGRALPGRTIVVLTRREDYCPDGVTVARSMDEALALARGAGETECFVGGGGEVYRAALEVADRLYLTLIHEGVDGDTYFPEWDRSAWREVRREDGTTGDEPFPFSFIDYERREVR